jgi:hypothetical protein
VCPRDGVDIDADVDLNPDLNGKRVLDRVDGSRRDPSDRDVAA